MPKLGRESPVSMPLFCNPHPPISIGFAEKPLLQLQTQLVMVELLVLNSLFFGREGASLPLLGALESFCSSISPLRVPFNEARWMRLPKHFPGTISHCQAEFICIHSRVH